MKRYPIVLMFLPYVINARVLPDHSHARIYDKAENGKENFLNLFFGSVQANINNYKLNLNYQEKFITIFFL